MLNRVTGASKLMSYIYIYIYSSLALALLVISPFLIAAFVTNGSAHADSLGYNINVAQVLNVTIPASSVVLNLNSTNKTFAASEDFSVTVATNNPTGYELTMSSTSTSLNRDSSLDGKTATIDTLPTLAGGYDDTTFVANKWGYKKNNGNYFPLSVGGDQILKSYYPTSGDTTTLNFASKINNDQPAGSYSTTIAFTAVAYPLVNYIQNITPGACPSDSPLLVVDIRDNQEYYIQKLADGNCWMLQNLKLGKTTTSIDLTSRSSDVSASGFTLNGKSSNGVFTDLTVDGVVGQNNSSQYYCTNDYGCYYNWYTATAGAGTTSVGSGSISSSICPAGWTLPSGGVTGQFNTLISYYPSTSQMMVNPSSATENINGASAPGFLAGGLYNSSGSMNVATHGYYWSRTAGSAQQAHTLYIDAASSGFSPVDAGNKYIGRSVRCIARDTDTTLANIKYMQDINTFVIENTVTGATNTLTDKRDNKKYTVAKLSDGNIWMTSNLNLAGGTKLYSETSNVPIGYPESGNTSFYQLPSSSTSGFTSTSSAYVYNTGNETTSQSDCTSSRPCNSYYSWLAATAGGKDILGSSVTSGGGKTAWSVCPIGWKLPSATTNGVARDSGGYTGGDFYKLAIEYGMNPNDSFQNSSNFYNQAGPGTTPNFLLTGMYESSTFSTAGVSAYGFYWSSSANQSTAAYGLGMNSSDSVYAAGSNPRNRGFPVRCVATL